MQILKRQLLLATIAGMTLFTACQKDVDEATETPVTPTAPTVARDAVKDSILAYTKDIYLWHNQIPATFDVQSYSDASKIMTAIRAYSTEPGFTKPVDRWSFAIDKKEWDKVSSGISGDLGLSVFFYDQTDLRVKFVEPASPAGAAGIRRGWRITKINGNTNMATSNSAFISNNIFYSPSSTITFTKPDNSSVDITLNAATYQEQPVMLDTVYNIDGKKIGYFVFNSFLGDTTQLYNKFNRVFNQLSSQNVTDLVVDLRYNGGGYVSVQEKLANYLAPMAANGNLMMKQEFNNKYSNWNSTDNFNKIGNLNLSRIFFIVSSSTASASELVINNLKPYMDVILVGPSNTYGKPVGYFPIPVASNYIFPVSFRTTNKNGQGSYFDGIPLNHKAADGLDKDWGDLGEASLASAIRYITTGKFTNSIRTREQDAQFEQKAVVVTGNEVLDRPYFKGSIDTRGMLK